MGKTLLITVLMIIGFSSVVNAGGWVLWEKSNQEVFLGDKYSNDFFLKDWFIVDAFPSYEQCKKAQKDSWESVKKLYGEDFDISNADYVKSLTIDTIVSQQTLEGKDQIGIIHRYKDGGYVKEWYRWKCLPDTVDPRK